jgi:hypothetical protein
MNKFCWVGILLVCSSLAAQNTSEQKARKLQQQLLKPQAQWDESYLVAVSKNSLGMLLDLLWDPQVHAKIGSRIPRQRPTLEVGLTGEVRTPRVNGSNIVIPLEYLNRLFSIGMLVGHDVYVSDNTVLQRAPLLSTPFRKSRLLPILDPEYVDPVAFSVLRPYLICVQTDPNCVAVQNYGVLGLELFAILHELTHELPELQPDAMTDKPSVKNEVAADKNAAALLKVVLAELGQLSPEAEKGVRFAFLAGPIVWLDLDARLHPDATVAKIRRDALLADLQPQDAAHIIELIRPQHSLNNIAHLRIRWKLRPSMIVIDGIGVAVGAVEGQVLTVASGVHTVVALAGNSIAFAAVSNHDAVIDLSYLPFADASAAELDTLLEAGKWLELLARTADETLNMKSDVLSHYHFAALHGLGLDRFILVQDWGSLPESDWKKVEEWQRKALPLESWR